MSLRSKGHQVKPESFPSQILLARAPPCPPCLSHLLDGVICHLHSALHRSMKVILGAHNIKAREETQQIMRVEKAIQHPAYDPKYHINDIMLLKVRPTSPWSGMAPPVLVPVLTPLPSWPSWCLSTDVNELHSCFVPNSCGGRP